MDNFKAVHRDVCIIVVDMVGYSRLMSTDETDTYIRWTSLRGSRLDPCVTEHGGSVVKTTGDGFLAIFDASRQGLACAVALQRIALADQEPLPDGRRIALRIGVHAANIIVEDNDIFGDGVNIAARLQTYAPPGGIAVSGAVMAEAAELPGTIGVDLGDLFLHNMARPVRMHCLRLAIASRPLIGEVPPGDDARPSIAVLPFRKNLTDPNESYFADGIVDDIIYALAGLKELFVIARGSTLGYAGPVIDVRAIGRELGVRYVLYGSVRRAAGRLRIVTELSDTETGTIVRSHKYDGDLEMLFDMQDRIALDVVNTIAPHVRERELTRALRKHPQNMTAYDLVLQAIDVLYRMDYESFSRAGGLLQRAIALDPFYATAYSYAAYWHVFRVGEGWSSDREADAQEAARLAEQALGLNHNDPQALAFYGHVQSFLLHDFERAIVYLDRAIAAGPSSSLAWTMNSATCAYLGRTALAVERGQQGLRLSPVDAHRFWPEGALAMAHYVNDDFAEAAALARMAAGRNGGVSTNLRTLAASLVGLDRLDEARGSAQQIMRIQPRFSLAAYARRCPFRGEVLERWIDRLHRAGLPD